MMRETLSRVFRACSESGWIPSPNPGRFRHRDISKTAVRDENGLPQKVYHATTEQFRSFRALSHFGSLAAAEQRMKSIYFDNPNYQPDGYFGPKYDARYVEARLNIQNPIELPDLGGHDYYHYEKELKDRKLLTDSECGYVFENADKFDFDAPPTWPKRLAQTLMRKGYDGIIYTNDVEDRGSKSYIVFRPEQVHVLGNIRLHDDNVFKKLMRRLQGPVPKKEWVSTFPTTA